MPLFCLLFAELSFSCATKTIENITLVLICLFTAKFAQYPCLFPINCACFLDWKIKAISIFILELLRTDLDERSCSFSWSKKENRFALKAEAFIRRKSLKFAVLALLAHCFLSILPKEQGIFFIRTA